MKEYKNIATFMHEATDLPMHSKELTYEIASLSDNSWKKKAFIVKYVDGDYIFAKMSWSDIEGAVVVDRFIVSEHNVKLIKAIAEMRLDFMDAN